MKSLLVFCNHVNRSQKDFVVSWTDPFLFGEMQTIPAFTAKTVCERGAVVSCFVVTFS